jgi:hypothetical protein
MSDYEEKIKEIFPADLFNITTDSRRNVSIKTKNPITNNNKKTENTTKFCLKLTFKEDNISISLLEKCGITGSELLNKVEKLARIISKIEYIDLVDASHIEKCDYIINLALLKILTKGESWYNSLGYKSSTYDVEVANNRKFMNMDCKTFFDYVFNKNFEKYMDIHSIEAIKARIKRIENKSSELRITEQKKLDNPNYIADISREYKIKESRLIEAMPPYDSGVKVKEYFENALSNLSCDNTNSFWLSEILDYISKSGIIIYDNNLSKLIYRETDLTEPEELWITPKDNGIPEGDEISGGKQKTRRKRRKAPKVHLKHLKVGASRHLKLGASRHLSKRTKSTHKYSGTHHH